MNAVSFVDWNGGYTVLAGWYPFDNAWAQATFTLGMDVFVVSPQGRLVGTISATPDEGFDKRLDVGPFDFVGAYNSFTYSSNSAFFVNGIGVDAGNRVFFRYGPSPREHEIYRVHSGGLRQRRSRHRCDERLRIDVLADRVRPCQSRSGIAGRAKVGNGRSVSGAVAGLATPT